MRYLCRRSTCFQIPSKIVRIYELRLQSAEAARARAGLRLQRLTLLLRPAGHLAGLPTWLSPSLMTDGRTAESEGKGDFELEQN